MRIFILHGRFRKRIFFIEYVKAASGGYPKKYESGFEIKIADDVKDNVYVAGAKIEDGILKTAGGRVLGVTAVEDTLEKAIDSSYAKVQKVSFDNAYYRKDIGKRALNG